MEFMMFKKVITMILIIMFSLNIEASYNLDKYMKVVDVQGNVKLEVNVKSSFEDQPIRSMVQKPARLGDLLFTRDTIITEASSLTAYLQNRLLLKIKENTSIYFDNTFDKSENIIFSLHKGEILIVSPMSYKPEYITVYTPDNSTINISGAAIVSFNENVTKVRFLHGYGKLNDTSVGQFTEVNLEDGITSNIFMNSDLRSIVNEILSMQYIDKVSQVNIYRDIAKLNNLDSFNVKQIITPIENGILIQ